MLVIYSVQMSRRGLLPAILGCAASGDLDAVRHCVATDPAAVTARNDGDHWTALHLAALFGQRDVVAFLLSVGANPNAPNRDGDTPVIAAVHGTDAATLRLMFEGGGDINAVGKYGNTPLHEAVRLGNEAAAAMLLSRAELNLTHENSSGQTADRVALLRPKLAALIHAEVCF